MKDPKNTDGVDVARHPFRTIAVWQAASFLLLLLLIWLNDILDLPACSAVKDGLLVNCFGPVLLSVFVVF